MEAETTSFESSDMLATFLASTPLLVESWKLCSRSNVSSRSIVTDEIEGVTYVAFSGVQPVAGLDPTWGNLIPLVHEGIFLAFDHINRQSEEEEEGKEPVMVHAGLLHLFLSMYNNPIFQNQVFCMRLTNEALFGVLVVFDLATTRELFSLYH